MLSRKILIAGLGLAAAVGLSACVDDGYGYGGGVGYVSDGYDPYYGGFNADPYWGWYGDYYYPGTGYYVYDRNRGRHRWNGGQQNYWRGRSQTWNNAHRDVRPMWRDFGGARGGVQGGRGPGGRWVPWRRWSRPGRWWLPRRRRWRRVPRRRRWRSPPLIHRRRVSRTHRQPDLPKSQTGGVSMTRRPFCFTVGAQP